MSIRRQSNNRVSETHQSFHQTTRPLAVVLSCAPYKEEKRNPDRMSFDKHMDIDLGWGDAKRALRKATGMTKFSIMRETKTTFRVVMHDRTEPISRSYAPTHTQNSTVGDGMPEEVYSVLFTRVSSTCKDNAGKETVVIQPLAKQNGPHNEQGQPIGGEFVYPSSLHHMGKDFEKQASAYDPPLIEKWGALRLAVIYGVLTARKAVREGGMGWLGDVMCP